MRSQMNYPLFYYFTNVPFYDFVREGLGEKRRGEFYRGARGIKSGDLLGDDRFIEEVLGRLGKDL